MCSIQTEGQKPWYKGKTPYENNFIELTHTPCIRIRTQLPSSCFLVLQKLSLKVIISPRCFQLNVPSHLQINILCALVKRFLLCFILVSKLFYCPLLRLNAYSSRFQNLCYFCDYDCFNCFSN